MNQVSIADDAMEVAIRLLGRIEVFMASLLAVRERPYPDGPDGSRVATGQPMSLPSVRLVQHVQAENGWGGGAEVIWGEVRMKAGCHPCATAAP